MIIMIMMMIRVLAATDRAQCTGRGLGSGQSGSVGGQTRLHRASGLHPGDDKSDNDSDDDDCIIQDRRRGNPAWSWTHNHKEYPTGKCCYLHTSSCFCFLASLARSTKINIGKYPATPQSQSFPRREGCVERNQLVEFLCFCIYGP